MLDIDCDMLDDRTKTGKGKAAACKGAKLLLEKVEGADCDNIEGLFAESRQEACRIAKEQLEKLQAEGLPDIEALRERARQQMEEWKKGGIEVFREKADEYIETLELITGKNREQLAAEAERLAIHIPDAVLLLRAKAYFEEIDPKDISSVIKNIEEINRHLTNVLTAIENIKKNNEETPETALILNRNNLQEVIDKLDTFIEPLNGMFGSIVATTPGFGEKFQTFRKNLVGIRAGLEDITDPDRAQFSNNSILNLLVDFGIAIEEGKFREYLKELKRGLPDDEGI